MVRAQVGTHLGTKVRGAALFIVCGSSPGRDTFGNQSQRCCAIHERHFITSTVPYATCARLIIKRNKQENQDGHDRSGQLGFQPTAFRLTGPKTTVSERGNTKNEFGTTSYCQTVGQSLLLYQMSSRIRY